MTGTAKALLDLDALAKPVGQVKKFGKVFDVHPLDGISQGLFAQLSDKNDAGEKVPLSEQLSIGLRILAQIVPDMTEEQRKRLLASEQIKLIMMAGTAIEHVEEFIRAQEGNGSRPALKGRASARSR